LSLTPNVIVNTDLVGKDDIKSWQDLLAPKWKGKMAMHDPRQGSGPATSGIGIFRSLGEDFWQKMAAQDITLHARFDLPVSQVVNGEKSLSIWPPYSRTIIAIKAGAPIRIVHLDKGTSAYVNAVNIVKNAPHPNASLVLLNWMLSREGQAAIGKAVENYSIRKDVNEDWITIPELNTATFTLLETPNNIDPAITADATEFSNKIFGPQ
jgi:iron(III) transport system substrate-binding protein